MTYQANPIVGLTKKQIDNFYSHIKFNEETGCWDWQGEVTYNGYGRFNFNWKKWKAHRISYELHQGKIPEGLQIDHLCRNRKCVNPKHLELVTSKENILRGISFSAINAKKTHCKNGHELSGDNVVIVCKKRICRICKRLSGRIYDKRRSKRRNKQIIIQRWAKNLLAMEVM